MLPAMTIAIEPLEDASAKASLCARLSAELPMWFGRPESNAEYIRGMATRDAFAAFVRGAPEGLIALDYHFGTTCNLWWLGVSPKVHRCGVGRALVERAFKEASQRGCAWLAVETMSPRTLSPEYDITHRFYEALGFHPFVEFEPEPGDYMMWMMRSV